MAGGGEIKRENYKIRSQETERISSPLRSMNSGSDDKQNQYIVSGSKDVTESYVTYQWHICGHRQGMVARETEKIKDILNEYQNSSFVWSGGCLN